MGPDDEVEAARTRVERRLLRAVGIVIERLRSEEGPTPHRYQPWGGWYVHADDDYDWDASESLDMSGVWARPLDEYVTGGSRLELVPMARARRAHEDEDLNFDDRAEFITAIRGNEYNPQAYADGFARGEAWFELVPEPRNPFDPHALAVDLGGVRAGYVGARMARRYQWLVRAANAEGKRCFTPGFIESPTSAWLALPTLHALKSGIPEDKHLRALRDVYESLPPDVLAEIESNGFHLGTRTSRQIFELRDRAPHLFPASPVPDHFSPAWDKVLQTARLARTAARAALRAQLRTDKAAEREIRLQARATEREQRRARVSELTQEGKSRLSIGAELGISAATVSSVLRELGLPVSAGGDNEYSASLRRDRVQRCLRALALQDAGASRRDISAELGVSEQSVKLLLADGRFYRSPDSYPERLGLARRAHEQGWSASTAKELGKRGTRAVRDAQALAQLASEA